MADKPTERVVYHGLFDYKNPDTGALAIAFKGDHIKVLHEDLERGERSGAFVTAAQAADAFPKAAPLEVRAEWLAGHTVEQAVEALRQDMSAAEPMREAEESRGASARSTLLGVLGQVLAN